jgi:hypothetical protein
VPPFRHFRGDCRLIGTNRIVVLKPGESARNSREFGLLPAVEAWFPHNDGGFRVKRRTHDAPAPAMQKSWVRTPSSALKEALPGLVR